MVTKDMLITDVLQDNREVAALLMQSGMHCLGCAMAHMETIEQACAVHAIDADALVGQINAYLEKKAAL